MSTYHDDLLLAEVRESVRRTAPPRHVVRQALDAFAWRNVALAVAELAFDSLVDTDDDLARVRGVGERRLMFLAPDASVDISVLNGQRLVGSVRPTAGGVIELRHTGGTDERRVDENGTFYFERVPHGAVSVKYTPGDEAAGGFVTEWITI